MQLTICLIVLIGALLIGWKFNFNFGIICLAFSFIVGVLVMDMKVSAIIELWPTSIIFYLVSIGLFFTYAIDNKTMHLLGQNVLYLLKGNGKMVPFVILIVTIIVSLLGAGPATTAIVGPFCFAMATAAGISPILVSLILVSGTFMGAGNPFNGYGGVISLGILENLGMENAFGMQMKLWMIDIVRCLITILIAYFILKGYKAKSVVAEKPEPFSPVQKKTLIIVLVAFVVMVVPTVLNTFIGGPFFKKLNQLCQPQAIMCIAAVIAAVLKLGNEEAILRKQSISTIVTIAGVCMLLEVANEAGLVDKMAGILGGSIPLFLIGPLFVLFAGFLNLFASGMTVCMMLYPIAFSIASATGLSYTALFAAIFVGSMSSSTATFSAGGAMAIAVCDDPKDQALLTRALVPTAVLSCVLGAIMSLLGLFNI